MKNDKGKHKGKNAMRTTEETVKLAYFFFKKKTSVRLSPAALLAAFFGKLIKFTESTCETTVNPF